MHRKKKSGDKDTGLDWRIEDWFVFAVAQIGLDHNTFWDLSMFEWSAYLERFHVKMNHIKAVDEGHWHRFRIQWADFKNAHFKKQGGGQFEPKDLINLSFDSDDNITSDDEPFKPVTFKEVKGALGATIKRDVSK